MANDSYVIIHWRQDLLGGLSRGHISPIGVYDKDTNSVLILDVAQHKNVYQD